MAKKSNAYYIYDKEMDRYLKSINSTDFVFEKKGNNSKKFNYLESEIVLDYLNSESITCHTGIVVKVKNSDRYERKPVEIKKWPISIQ